MRQTTAPKGPTATNRYRWPGVGIMLLAGGLLAAACGSSSSSSSTTAASGGSGSGLDSLVNGISKSSSATFSATYVITEASTGKTETVTFAQSPPKSAVTTTGGSFYIDGTSITECQGTGTTATCTTLPSTMSSLVSGITNLISPDVIAGSLKGVEAEAAAKSGGYVVSTSSATYGGQSSSCVTARGTSEATPVTYCGSRSNGILTYLNADGNTVTLQTYTASPPASTFAPPPGATMQTLPAGA